MIAQYQSCLAIHFERFVTLKQASGFRYITQARLLVDFDRYLVQHAIVEPLCRKTMLAYLATLDRLSPRGRDNMVNVVWQALVYARLHGTQINLPPTPPRAPAHFRMRPPRLISKDEICAIIAVARLLPPLGQLRSATYATLFGLLFATGMRISEALALDIEDIDFAEGMIAIRHGKFDKSRVLPLRTSTLQALNDYVNDPRRAIGKAKTDPLFVSKRRQRLTYCWAAHTFKSLCKKAKLSPLPRPHDMRHSFAILRVIDWYQKDKDINVRLPALSTYLGHVSVENTRTYLQANAILLEEASQRFARKCPELSEVRS